MRKTILLATVAILAFGILFAWAGQDTVVNKDPKADKIALENEKANKPTINETATKAERLAHAKPTVEQKMAADQLEQAAIIAKEADNQARLAAQQEAEADLQRKLAIEEANLAAEQAVIAEKLTADEVVLEKKQHAPIIEEEAFDAVIADKLRLDEIEADGVISDYEAAEHDAISKRLDSRQINDNPITTGILLDFNGSETFDSDLGEFTNHVEGDASSVGWQWLSSYMDYSGIAYHDDDNVATTCEDYLVSNGTYTVPDVADASLYYDENVNYRSSADSHAVLITTSYTGDPTTTTWEVLSTSIGTEDTWEHIEIDLTNTGGKTDYRNQAVTIAFYYEGDYADEWYLDNVGIGSPPGPPIGRCCDYTDVYNPVCEDSVVEDSCQGTDDIWTLDLNCTDNPCLSQIDCTNPFQVTLPADMPYADNDQSTENRGDNNTSYGCGYYQDHDLVYELTVTADVKVDITLDPKGTLWTSIGLMTACDGSDSCVDYSEDNTGNAHKISGADLTLAQGTYYLWVDSWTNDDYIPDFDLTIGTYVVPTGRCCDYTDPLNVICHEAYTDSQCTYIGGDWSEDETCTSDPCRTLSAGDNCDFPMTVTLPAALPYVDSNQTNCGRMDDYDVTCLGLWDTGEDMMYELVVTSEICVDIQLDPNGTGYSAFCVDSTCPPSETSCMYTSTKATAEPHGLNAITLVAGTYYLMVDTYAMPNCIDDFDLSIAIHVFTDGDDCDNPITVSLPADVPYNDLNQTTCGRGNNYEETCLGSYDGGEDIIYEITVTASDYYLFSLNPYSDGSVGMGLAAECPLTTCIFMEDNGWAGGLIAASAYLEPGTYYLMIDTWPSPTCIDSFNLTIDTFAPTPGDNCTLPIELTTSNLPYTYSDSTCGRGDDYDNTCLGSFDEDQDILYSFTNDGSEIIFLDILVDSTAGLGDLMENYLGLCVDDNCPPDGDCIDYATSSSLEFSISLVNIEVGIGQTVYIMLDNWSEGCFYFDMNITGTTTGPEGRCCYGDLTNPDCIDSITEADCYADPYYGHEWLEAGNCTDDPCLSILGNDCVTPIVVDINTSLPYYDSSQTTCGRVDDYYETCLGSYDGGEDIIYQLNVTSAIWLDISVEGLLNTEDCGMALSHECVDFDSCLIYITDWYGDLLFEYLYLEPGTYYLIIDTWPSPECFDFDLAITSPGPPPTGRCCYDYDEFGYNSTCVDGITVDSCDVLDGEWVAGLNCTSDPCPEGPPANDSCANAMAVTESTYTVYNKFATDDGAGISDIHKNVWFCYTASGTGIATIDLCDSDHFDTELAAYDGCTCDPLGDSLNFSDDADYCGYFSLLSAFTLMVEDGHTYLIEAGNHNTSASDGGYLVLNISLDECTPPANDDCADAEAITGAYPATGSGSTYCALGDCTGWNNVWYTIDLPYDWNEITITVCPTSVDLYDGGLILTEDCDCNGIIFADSYSFPYESCVEGYDGVQMVFDNVYAGPGGGTIYWPAYLVDEIDNGIDFNFTVDVTEVIVAQGDRCEDPFIVTFTGNYYSDTQNSCDFNHDYHLYGEDVVYEVTFDSRVEVTFQLCNSPDTFDSYLVIYPGDDCGGFGILTDDDDCGLLYGHAIITDSLDAGTYYVLVDAYTSGCGNYLLEITKSGGDPTGACCVAEVCVATNTEAECDALGGGWHEGETCPEYDCTISCYEFMLGDINMYNGTWPPAAIGGDVTYLVNYFRGMTTSHACNFGGFWASADVNGDCNVIGSDVTKMVGYLRGVGTLSWCADYVPCWMVSGDLPGTMPTGWPNCDSPLFGKDVQIIPTDSGK